MVNVGEPRIRQAVADDAFIVAALTLQFARDVGAKAESGFLDRCADAWLRNRRLQPAWIAEFAGQHAGLVRATEMPFPWPGDRADNRLWVDVLYVGPAFRKIGLGEAMLRVAIEHGRQIGARQVRLRAEPSARALYQKVGFEDPGTLMEMALV